jgi:hypothetical protein
MLETQVVHQAFQMRIRAKPRTLLWTSFPRKELVSTPTSRDSKENTIVQPQRVAIIPGISELIDGFYFEICNCCITIDKSYSHVGHLEMVGLS